MRLVTGAGMPDGPFRLVEVRGSCHEGIVWSAVDGQGRWLTVAILNPALATDQQWRAAFTQAATAYVQARPGLAAADLAASPPWVSCLTDGGPAAEQVFLSMGGDFHPFDAAA